MFSRFVISIRIDIVNSTTTSTKDNMNIMIGESSKFQQLLAFAA